MNEQDRGASDRWEKVAGAAQLVDEICDRFEADWKEGPPPDLAGYLDRAPPGRRAQLLRDLVCIDLEYRWRSAAALHGNRI